MSTYEEDIEEFVEQWDEIQPFGSGRELRADDYQAKIAVSRVERAPWEPNPWTWYVEYEAISPGVHHHEMGTQPMRYDLEHKMGESLAKGIAQQLGWEDADKPGSLRNFRKVVESGLFDDVVCDIRVKDKPGESKTFKQVFINGVHGKHVDSGPVDADIPF